jgi:REP element-mobilizing transposase RayT
MKYNDEHFYHVYNRGSRSEDIFFSKINYEYFLHLVKKNAVAHSVHLVAYCLMPNHYHMVLQQKEHGSISKFIQSVMTSYVQAMNKKYKISGTLFQGKAKSKFIDSDEYVLQVIRYVHLNPVNAGLVQKPEDWPFSDYSAWIEDTNRTSPTAISDRRGLMRDAYFASGNKYRQFVEEYRIEQANEKLDKFLFKE